MSRNDSYNTKQKELILNVLKSKKKEFTIKEIYDEVKECSGLTTVYRLVDKLVEENIIVKNIGKNNITYYQYLEKCNANNHFYLKCEKCGSIEHVDCDCIIDLNNHIAKEHNFKPNNEKIIINGVCKNCI